MSTSLKQQTIARQLLILTVAIIAIAFGTLIAVVSHLSHKTALHQAEESLQHEIKLITSFLDYTFQTQVTTAKRRMGGFKKLLPGKLVVTKATMKTGDAEDIPVVRAGNEVMNNNLQYLETLKQVNTAEGFILAKKGNDYVRVATLLKDDKGASQVGKALKPDEPQVAALNRGEDFIGIVHRNGRTFMSIYEPIRDEDGKVVGAFGLRSNLENDLNAVREIIKQQKVGTSGYFFVFSDAGPDIGRLTIHPSKEGKTIRELFEAQPAIQAQFRTAMNDKGGSMRYLWPNPARGGAEEAKLTVVGYSKEWNWYFGAGTFVEELTTDAIALRNVVLLSTVIAAIVICLAIFLGVTRRLKPLRHIVDGLSAIGAGKLTVRLPESAPNSRNELDILGQQLNATSDAIRSLIKAIVETSEHLSSSAQQLDHSSKEVAIAVQEESDAAASMAASVEEFAVSISQVADLAQEASNITRDEYGAAQTGGGVVNEVKGEMEVLVDSVKESGQLVASLGKRSAEIEGIVRLIQDVAEQTNLLALNAAIEAARAGEQGRGFAVVADEVRKLAERTAKATSEISQVIHGVRTETEQVVAKMQIVENDVNSGVAKVEKAGEALEGIRTQSERSASVVDDIASATHEQSAASNEVARKLESIAQMIEETAAITAQNRESAADLGTLATQLQNLVRRFEI